MRVRPRESRLTLSWLLAAAVLLPPSWISPRATAEAGRAAVIVHPPSLAGSAEAWAAYRRSQDWDITLIAVEPGETAESLRGRIHAVFEDRPMASETRAALLLGDIAGSDDDPQPARGNGIPTFRFPQEEPALLRGGEPSFPSDHPFALPPNAPARVALDASIGLGRVPVASDEEAFNILEKIKRYESLPATGAWRRRMTYVAGEGRFGPFDRLLESLFIRFADEILPPSFDLTMTYAKPGSPWCPPPSMVEQITLLRLTEGSLLFTYLGHGHAQGLDSMRVGGRRFPILRADALQDLPANDRLPIALLACCSTGWFDLAPKDGRERKSLAESMLLAAQGPIAIIAGTRPTHPYGNAVMQKELTRVLVASREATLGEIDRATRIEMMHLDEQDRTLDRIVRPVALMTDWKLSLAALRLMHVRMYVLFGDPMLRVIDHGEELEQIALRPLGNHRLLELRASEGTIRTIEVIGEVARPTPPERPDGAPLPDAFAPLDVIERDARERYPLANVRVRLQVRTPPRVGFSPWPVPWLNPFAVGSTWPAAWSTSWRESTIPFAAHSLERIDLLRVRVTGVRDDGSAFEAFGGLRISAQDAPDGSGAPSARTTPATADSD
jgi:hypothetical protein